MTRLLLAMLVAGCTDRTDLLANARPPSCTAPGPAIQLGDDGPCAGALAAHLLKRALCACGALHVERGLFTQSLGMHQPSMGAAAAVGIDDSLQVDGPTQVAGTLDVAGGAGATFRRTSAVLGTLRSGGAIVANQFLGVDADAWAGGDVLGRIDVGGVLHATPFAAIGPGVSASDVVFGPVAVELPCNCAAGPAVDLPALAAKRARANDDARLGLSPASGDAPLDLPCGEFFVQSLTTNEVSVHGRAALYVGGDATLGDGLRVLLDDGAELDLVIAGNLSLATGVLGAPTAASVRVWVGGAAVKVGAGASFSAALYAPSATVTSDGDLTVTGALYARAIVAAGDVGVRFDQKVLADGASCGAPPEPPVP
jgi:hypothetical protein